MHHIFKKNYNLIIKNFIPMCLPREHHYPSHVAVLYRLRVIRVKLPYSETAPHKIQQYLRDYSLSKTVKP